MASQAVPPPCTHTAAYVQTLSVVIAVALCHQSVTVRLVSAAADAVVSFECMQECPEISFLQNDIGGTTQFALQPKWEG